MPFWLTRARRAGRPVLLLEDQPVEQVGSAAAVLLRPGDDGKPRVREPPFPVPMRGESLGGVERRQRLRRHVRGQPRPHLGAARVARRSTRQVHADSHSIAISRP